MLFYWKNGVFFKIYISSKGDSDNDDDEQGDQDEEDDQIGEGEDEEEEEDEQSKNVKKIVFLKWFIKKNVFLMTSFFNNKGTYVNKV